MATNSGTAGYLAPSSAQPLNGDALDDLFQGVLAGITGIDGNYIRPRWQPEPPIQPDFNVDWIAFGVAITKDDTFPYIGHDGVNDVDIVERDQTLTILHSFYGPNGMNFAGMYNTGIQVEQNRDALTAVGIKLVECQEVTTLPALLKEKWVKRYDCRTVFRRRIKWIYPILTVVAGNIGLDNEHYITNINPSTP